LSLTKEHLKPETVSRMLADDGTLATCLQIIALAAYGDDIYKVDAMEIVMRLEEDFHTRLTDDNENKLKAILIATCTDVFYEDPEACRGIGNTLLVGDPGLDQLDPLTIPELMFATYEVELNHGPGEFLPGVMALIESVMEGEMTDPEGNPVDADPHDYVWQFLEEMHKRLKNQLLDLGVDGSLIPDIHTPHLSHESKLLDAAQ
jgi:hypothetical protein